MVLRPLYRNLNTFNCRDLSWWLSRNHRQVNFSGKSKEGLSRTERRLLERKQKNKERKESSRARNEQQGQQKKTMSNSRITQIRKRFAQMLHPKVPGGGNLYFGRHHFAPLMYRLPLFFAFCFLVTNEEYSPIVFQGSIGPSMLPTIQFIGDLWLIETWSFHRLFRLEIPLQRGDVVIWKDPKTQRVSCKRIIGVEGDIVSRYGEFAQLYKDREDWGIVVPSDAESRNLNLNWDGTKERKPKDILQEMVVPTGHVWLEGDCPPFSLDSRHFGPISMSWIRGRLIYRVWPLKREDEDGNLIPFQLSRKRPVPFSSIDDYLGKKYNFFRISGNNNSS